MRKIFNEQPKLGVVDISKIKIDMNSRDQVPRVLLGLQFIYANIDLRHQVFNILEEVLPQKSKKGLGRNEMSAWEILVLASIKLSCDTDYDHLKEMSDNHNNIRYMLGLSPVFDEEKKFGLQTLKDNVALLKPEVLGRINQLVVEYGQLKAGKKPDAEFLGRCDSSVVRTDVHFPTDINLLFDAIRKVITLTSRLCNDLDIPGWRQSKANIKSVKKRYRTAAKLKHSTSKNPEKQEERKKIIQEAYRNYLDIVSGYIEKTMAYINIIRNQMDWLELRLKEIEHYIAHAERQIDQTYRRVIDDEKIPHDEKIFSVFEEHTEWISKGKAGVPQELGIRVAIVEDEFGFIIGYYIGEKQTDDKIAIPLLSSVKEAFPLLRGCSFDKGFYTPDNKKRLRETLEQLTLPKKGKRNPEEQKEETAEEFQKARKQHSAVESAIASLQNHGFKKCKDKEIEGFERHIALTILAFNIHKLGAIIQKREQKSAARKKKYNQTYAQNRSYKAA